MTEQQGRKDQFVGASVPPRLARLLTLRTLYLKTSKTHLFCEMLENLEDTIPIQEMLVGIAQRFGVEWDCIVQANQYRKDWDTEAKILLQFEKYLKKITQEFKSKKLTDEDIETIIQRIREDYAKDKAHKT